MNRPAPTPTDLELLQERFARRCTARLAASELPHDVSERLRAARERALAARRATAAAAAPAGAVLHGGGGTAVLGGGSWRWLAPVLLLALAAGSMLIAGQQMQPAHPKPAPMPAMGTVGTVGAKGAVGAVGTRNIAASPIALIDVALVTDPLPPHAYADPGFMHFLRQTAAYPDMAPPGEHIIAPAPAPAPASDGLPETAPQ